MRSGFKSGDPASIFRVLGGSWVVVSRVLSRVTIIIAHVGGLITPLIATHEPPSTDAFGKHGIPASDFTACCYWLQPWGKEAMQRRKRSHPSFRLHIRNNRPGASLKLIVNQS